MSFVLFWFGILVIYSSTIQAINIDCVPLDDCPSANNILVNRTTISRSILTFINSTKCGIDETTKKFKVWCSRFANCRGPDQRFGTCIDVTTCMELETMLDTTQNDQERLAMVSQYRCHLPNVTDILVCCPWATTSQSEPIKRKKRYAPWYRHLHTHEISSRAANDEKFEKRHHSHHSFQNRFEETSSRSEPYFHSSEQHENVGFVNYKFGGSSDEEDGTMIKPEQCLTPDNKIGTCMDVYQCSHLVNVLENADTTNHREVEYLKGYQCPNSEGSLQICCPAQTKREIADIQPTRSRSSDDYVDTDFNSCGSRITSNRIVGGDLADVSEYPWTALIRYRKPSGDLQFGCGGSIINYRYIVTAAHCVNKRILRENGFAKIQNIVLGEYDTRNKTDCFWSTHGSECADEPQVVGVEKIIEHRLFKKKGNVQHDIALIRVDRNIKFTEFVKPICIPKRDAQVFVNQNFFIAGWGISDDGKASPKKKKAMLKSVDRNLCNQKGELGEGQICLDSRAGVDSCKGDSGGPVMYTTVENGDILTILVGIISYGFGTCGTTTSVSTYVPFYLDWIKDNVV